MDPFRKEGHNDPLTPKNFFTHSFEKSFMHGNLLSGSNVEKEEQRAV